jgi:tRNA-specific 2-thiouridylase
MMTDTTLDKDAVVVAMSGGVDSSVAALLIQESGLPAVGVSMQVWDYRNHGGCSSRATCCAPDDFTDARMVAAKVGIPYYVFDFEQSFRKEVIDRFVDTYAIGETPNPCVDCNNRVKFKELRQRAESLGCESVATGHYARIESDNDGNLRLMRGVDLNKDQSYFLYGVLPEELSKTIFPVGEMTKEEVRERAREFGLVTAEKAESQDICFVQGSVQDFLVKLGGKQKSGSIVRTDGTVVGQHDGIHNFTVGQRRGLAIGGTDEPLYVLELDAALNRVFVGERDQLVQESFSVRELNWINAAIRSEIQQSTQNGKKVQFEAIAQLRHRHKGVLVALEYDPSTDEVVATFKNESSTVSPGQAAVFYDLNSEEVLGGGRIVHLPRWAQQAA